MAIPVTLGRFRRAKKNNNNHPYPTSQPVLVDAQVGGDDLCTPPQRLAYEEL
jgi:hypothetical protein